jgi:hypothetical protein
VSFAATLAVSAVVGYADERIPIPSAAVTGVVPCRDRTPPADAAG